MKWLNAGDIKNWVNGQSRHCQEKLPELIRRLILAHAVNATELFDFPSGGSVTTGGWDGRLKTSIVSPFFPSGVSGWEMGVESSAGTKAEDDYTKRTANPLGFTLNDTTFVFVTPRAWPGRTKWCTDKRASNTWKDIRVVNADQLEQWLDISPAVALWLARQLGKVSNSIRDLEAFWEEWSLGTRPPMTPNLVIAGRNKDTEEIQKWLTDKPTIHEVLADHPDEAFAFLYSSIATMPDIQKTQALSRCVLVANKDEMRNVIYSYQNYPLIIAAPSECIPVAPLAESKGHHVFISLDSTVVGIRSFQRLLRPQRSVIEKTLHEQGMSETEAQKCARDAGHSIPVLRRRLSSSSTVNTPKWANNQSAQWLIPVLLIGAWSEEKEGDRTIIETLSGMKHDTFITGLKPFLAMDDSPIRKIGNIWMIKSPLDAWYLIRSHLTSENLTLFEKSLLSVLTETNPKYTLSPEKRWAAAMYGKTSPYSGWVRNGLVEALTLLALYGDNTSDPTSSQNFANGIVSKIFSAANKWQIWASLKDETPLLAEAAPELFMKEVQNVLTKTPKVFQELMEGGSDFFDECKHSGLLWALERIAWSSEHFSQAVILLADLAAIDKGGKWENRAVNSLKDAFRPGYPQTYASPEERLTVLGSLIKKYPILVWKFAQGYFRQDSFSESHQFRWRETGGTRGGLEREDMESFQKYLAGFFPMMDELACSKENIIAAVGIFTSLSSNLQDKLLAALSENDPESLSTNERNRLLDELRDALNWISSYGDETIRKQIPALKKTVELYEPKDPLERYGWLLSSPWPELPEAEKDYETRQSAVKKAQEDAARKILRAVPLDKILTFAKAASYPGVLGVALGKAVQNKKEDAELFDWMLTHINDIPVVIQGYADGRITTVGQVWISDQIKRMKTKGNYSDGACALIYLGLPESREVWQEVEKNGKGVESVYWKHARGYTKQTKEDAAIATEKLLDAGRPDQALEIAGAHDILIPSALLKRLVLDFLAPKDKKRMMGTMDQYHIGNVFRQIYQQTDLSLEEIASLEWPFAKMFDDIRAETKMPMAIHRLLQNNPSYFVQMIRFLYKRHDGKPDPMQEGVSEEAVQNRALGAQEVLYTWSALPGLKSNGTIDEKVLSDWIETVRKQCAEIDRAIPCDANIGIALAHSPMGTDGAWPHESVRNLLERIRNDIIEKHIIIGVYNSRGVVTRSLDEGGEQERGLAQKYKSMSEIIKTKWPRTAAMLQRMAKSYEHDAEREDIDNDLHDIRYD